MLRLNDAVLGAALAGAGIAIVVEAQTFPALPGQQYGSAFFPTLIGIALAGCGLGLIGKTAFTTGILPLIILPDWLKTPRAAASVVLALAALVFYMLAAEHLGFALTALLILLILQLWLKVRPALAGVVAVTTVAVMHLVFVVLLRVPLPRGVIERWL